MAIDEFCISETCLLFFFASSVCVFVSASPDFSPHLTPPSAVVPMARVFVCFFGRGGEGFDSAIESLLPPPPNKPLLCHFFGF